MDEERGNADALCVLGDVGVERDSQVARRLFRGSVREEEALEDPELELAGLGDEEPDEEISEGGVGCAPVALDDVDGFANELASQLACPRQLLAVAFFQG